MVTQVDIELTAMAHGGLAVGRFDGRVIFVRGGIPGELVKVSIVESRHKSYWYGEVAEVLTPSQHRVNISCPVGSGCGACDYQHIEPGYQLELKRQIIAEQLKRLADIDWDGHVEPCDKLVHWRTRMRYDIVNSQLTMHKFRSSELIFLPEQGCLLADETQPSVAKLSRLAKSARTLQVISSDDQVSVLADQRLVMGERIITQTVLGKRYQLDAAGFWQIHPEAGKKLVATVLKMLSPNTGEQVLDLYCGAGLFTAALVDQGLKVWGVETDRQAASFARKNASGAQILAMSTEQALSKLPRKTDLIVVDPPRKGVGIKTLKRLVALKARSLVYVACDPASLARDIALLRQYGYQLVELQAFDLFPRTHHVESVALLSMK